MAAKNVVYADIPSKYTFEKEKRAGHTIIVNGNFNLKNYPLDKFPDIMDREYGVILNGEDVEVADIIGVDHARGALMTCRIVKDFSGKF